MNEPTSSNEPSSLEQWLRDPGTELYLGRHTMFKLDCLAHVLGVPGSLADIGRKYGVTRHAAYFHAAAARKAFGIPKVKG